MPNPFYSSETTPLGGAPSGTPSTKVAGGVTIHDDTYSAGNPFAQDAGDWQNGLKVAKINKLAADAKTAVDAENKPESFGTQLKDTVTGLPGGIASVIGGFATNPLGSLSAIGGGLMDAGPAAVNTMDALYRAVLNHVYGSTGFIKGVPGPQDQGQGPIDLPFAGQTMNEYIGNNSNVSQALGQSAKMVSSYEIGGGIASEMGLGATITDAAGNIIPRATLASRVAGNVIGGQIITDPKASAADRAKQAAFDAAFGVADTAARGVMSKFGDTKATRAAVTKVATQSTEEAKNTVMDRAISTFSNSGNGTYDLRVAKKLNIFLNSDSFENSKTMVDFETNLQKALGDDFNDAEVRNALQPIIDEGHAQVASKVAAAAPAPKSPARGPVTVKDLFNPDVAEEKASAQPAKAPETKYIAKDNLGKDSFGNKRLAQTQVDTRTGNAIVYYDKSLDADLNAKKIVLDHEEGHILDKRLNGGNNISAEVGNYTGNGRSLEKALGDFAKKNQMTVPQAAANLKADIGALADDATGPMNEQFAEAVSRYRANPAEAYKTAPTFSRLMEYVPQDGNFSEHSTSLESLNHDSPVAAKMVREQIEKASAEARVRKTSEKLASTGLDTGKTVDGRTSFNPDKINAPQDVETLFSKMDAQNENFSPQRIAKSNEDIKDLARMVGLKPEDLINAKPGSIANAETLTAARQLVMTKAQALVDRLKGVDVANASEKELKALKDDYARLIAMQQTVAGLRTEASNTLRSLSIEVAPGEDFTLKDMFQKMQQMGIASKWDADLFSQKVGEDMQLSTRQKIAQGAMKTWYASILSGPATPVRHGLSVMSNVATDIVSKLGNPALWKEVVPAFKALINNLGPAFADAKAAFNATGAEAKAFDDLNSTRPPVFTGKWATYGKVTEVVGRYMDAAATGYTRIAKEVENASLEVYSPRMGNELQKALAASYAESINYMGEPKGYVAQRVLAAGKALTAGETNPLRILVPFQRVVSNVLDRQFDYIPGTSFFRATDRALEGQVDNIMKKFDLTSTDDRAAILGRLKAQQYGRATIGMAVSIAAFVAARAGMVSGSGPTDYNAKLELERTGWRPDSLKIGDVWLPYDYLGPLSGIFAMAGNMNDAIEYDKTANSDPSLSAMFSKGMMGWMQSQLNRSFLKGVSDLMQALTDKTKQQSYIKNLGAEILQPLAPKAIVGTRQIISAAMGDEYQYQTHGIIDKLRAEWGLTGSVAGMPALEPQTNAFGEPLKADIIFGITPSVSKADAVDNYLRANDVVITIPSRNTQYTDPENGKKRSMTDAEYGAYIKESGKQIYQNLEAMIPDLQGEDIDTQRSEIRAMLSSVRTDVREGIMSQAK